MSKFEANIKADAGARTRAIYESVKADNEFYPENPSDTDISYDGSLHITVRSESLPHLRANDILDMLELPLRDDGFLYIVCVV